MKKFYYKIYLITLLFFLSFINLFGQTTVTYNFESLTNASAINGQDNWKVQDAGTSTSISSATIQSFTSSGGYTGSKGLNIPDIGGTHQLYVSRINDRIFHCQQQQISV